MVSLISEELAEYDATQKNVATEIENVKNRISDHTANDITKEEMQELFKSVPQLLKELDREGQRKLIDYIINEIRWYMKTGEKEG